MCKKIIMEQIIALVAREADLSPEVILSSSRRPEIVDARYVAIYLMLRKGIPISRISEYMMMTERNVYHVRERFDDRVAYGDPMIEHFYNSVLDALK